MARDVHAILVDIAQTFGELPAEKAAAFIKELTQKGRYSQDVWSWIPLTVVFLSIYFSSNFLS